MNQSVLLTDTLQRWYTEHRAQVRRRIVELTCEMVRCRSVNVMEANLAEHPYLKVRGQEADVARLVQNELKRVGIEYSSHSRVQERPNVIGRLGRNESGVRLMLAGHMDVVPAGTGWTKLQDPFEPRETDGVLYGRGVLDNKGPLAAALVATTMLREALGPDALAGQLQLAALCDEEATDGADCGIGFLLEQGLVDATCAIVPDIGEFMKSIDVAEKGGGVIRITAKGVQAHGSTPERGVNAIVKMAKLIEKLEPFPFDYKPHELLLGPTMNIGEITGGAAPNIVPASCSITIDLRLVPGQTMQQVQRQMQQIASQVAPDFEIEIIDSRDPHAMDPSHPLVSAIQRRADQVLGFKPSVMGLGGATFAKALNLAGIAAVGWGPGDDNAFHVADEYISVAELENFALVVALVAVDLLA